MKYDRLENIHLMNVINKKKMTTKYVFFFMTQLNFQYLFDTI